MPHPLDFIQASSRKKIFFPLLVLTLGLLGVFQLLDAPLQNPVSSSGIVSFELAGTPSKADAITQSWDARAQLFAAFGLGLDYLFMIAYGLTISLGVLMAASKQGGGFEKASNYVGWGVLVATLFDAIENFFLWQILIGGGFSFYPRMAAVSAMLKFILLIIGLGFALTGWLWKKKE